MSLPERFCRADGFAQRGSIGVIAIATVVAALAVGLYFFHFRFSSGSVSAAEHTSVVAVQRKPFVRILRLTGTTAAVHSRPILAPRLAGAQLGSMVITRMASAGQRVKKGDLLVEFDRMSQYKDFLDKQADYLKLQNQVAGKQAEEDAARAKDDTDLKQAEDALAKAKLELRKSKIESRIEAEKAQEQLEEAKATLSQLRHTYELKRQEAAAEIGALQTQLERAHQTMLYAQTNAQKMIIRSPMKGIVVLNTIWLNGRMGEVQPGTEVRPGVPFMRVVDPSAMNVRVEANQTDMLALQVDQHATIRLDAYPELSFPGTLEALSPLGYPGQFSEAVRSFSAVFSIQGANPKLMPDLTAAVDVELDREKDALVVPVQSVTSDKDGPFVWLQDGGGFEKRRVRTGPENDLMQVIEAGLKAGDKIRENALAAGGMQAEK